MSVGGSVSSGVLTAVSSEGIPGMSSNHLGGVTELLALSWVSPPLHTQTC